MHVALAHHWLTQYRGGERVLEQVAALFPGSDLYTLLHRRGFRAPGIRLGRVITSGIQQIPGASQYYRHLLPLHPWAIRRLRVDDRVDLLVSSDAAMIKGLSLADHTKHVCYCHSPPRYLWELGEDYKRTSMAARIVLDRVAPRLRRFDHAAAQRVDHFIANSQFVAGRIEKYYQRDAEVVYPPVAVNTFRFDRRRETFSLVVSELVPYKRIDLAVRAFRGLDRRLVVIGGGPERQRLERLATPNVEFLGRQPFHVLKWHLERASQFIFPGIEDFGIAPVEAQAAGCPVIAYRGGGALETVIAGRTGKFFDEPSPAALRSAATSFEASDLTAAQCRRNAERFSVSKFQQRMKACFMRWGLPAGTHGIRDVPLARQQRVGA